MAVIFRLSFSVLRLALKREVFDSITVAENRVTME